MSHNLGLSGVFSYQTEVMVFKEGLSALLITSQHDFTTSIFCLRQCLSCSPL